MEKQVLLIIKQADDRMMIQDVRTAMDLKWLELAVNTQNMSETEVLDKDLATLFKSR